MTKDIELKFPFDESNHEHSAWAVDQEPMDLLALWPGGEDDRPTQTEVIAALRDELGEDFEVLEEVEPPSPEVQWSIAARFASLRGPVIVWTQSAMRVPAGELGDPEAEACRWVIGFETMLDVANPLDGYITLMKAIARAFPESPAVIDVNSTMIHSREHLDETYGKEEDGEMIEPAAEDLWMIHVVHAPDDGAGENKPTPGSAQSGAESGMAWLHTHGLCRCGLPELEMLEVPAKHASTAAELLNDVAGLLFEFPPPPPGEPYEIGDDLAVAFQPWREIVELMAETAPGGPADRREDAGENPHAGVRAVICGAEKRGTYRQVWSWPREVIERLEQDQATIYMTQRATDRQARMAKARWSELATAFASAQKASLVGVDEPRAVFLVKAGYPVDGERDGSESAAREHLWFEVHHFGGDCADATLINQPVNVPALRRGDRTRVHRSEVSDWQVQTVAGTFGPHDVARLWKAIDALKEDDVRH